VPPATGRLRAPAPTLTTMETTSEATPPWVPGDQHSIPGGARIAAVLGAGLGRLAGIQDAAE
jgi:hypothetical protein